MTPVCARPGCERPIPPFAAGQGERFCSRPCFAECEGYITAEEARAERKAQRNATGTDELKSQVAPYTDSRPPGSGRM